MSNIELVIEKNETEKKEPDKKNRGPFAALLCLMAGVYGMLLFFQSMLDVSFINGAVAVAPALLCPALWYSWFYKKKMFLVLMAVVLAVSGAAAFMMRDVLTAQLVQLAGGISGKTDLNTLSVTDLAFMLAVSVSMVLFVFEVILHNHMILFLSITGTLLMAPLWGIRPGTGAVVLLVFFLVIFWAEHLPQKAGNCSLSLKRKSVRAAAFILAVSLLAAGLLASHYAQELYKLAYTAEEFVYRTAEQLSGRAGDLVSGGRIHGGNNYRTGTAHLELTVSRQPGEILYLRGFGGGEYTGGEWIRSSDEELFSAMAETLDWREWENMISGMYYSMYFVMNSYTRKSSGMEPFFLTIRHLNGEYGNAYVPYYSQRDRGQYSLRGDETGRDGYGYHFFEQPDMDIKWDHVSSGFEQSRDWYMELRDAYMQEIQTAYTQVPAELLPRMIELVEENPMNGLNEISAFILYTLHSNASYTLTPGWAPLNEDIAEYFLFESGRGYCEHFALAATLLYRMYGIPARYATGYMVQPSDFELQEDGNYGAVVTDEDAHAWTEIFLEDYGWTPVEVTPAEDGSSVAGYPGFDSLELNRILSERNWDRMIPGLNAYENSFADVQDTGIGAGAGWKTSLKEHGRFLWVFGTVFLYSLFLSPFFLDYCRLRHLKKIETMNCRKVFSKYMKMLHFVGYFQKYDGSEEDFAEVFAVEIPAALPDEIRQVQNIVCEAAFGSGMPSAKKEEFVRKIYFQTGRMIYGDLPWYRKLIFRYWYMFG